MSRVESSKFNMQTNPPYQIDFQNVASGKRVAQTKRRVRFRFGFSNKEALAKGLTAIDCRGEEHEVVLVWSLTSGKRLVTADGEEVHFSQGGITESKFETTWTMNGGHIIKLIAYAAPPLFETPGFKQFDLLLDGYSYFDMPKIYELGVRKNKSKARAIVPSTQPGAYNNYSLSDSSREVTPDFARAPPNKRRPDPVPVEDVISSENKHHNISHDLLDAPTSTVQQSASLIQDEFSPVETVPQPPSFSVVSNQIMSNYAPALAPSNTVLALANEPHTHYVPQQMPPQHPVYDYQQPQRHQGYYSPQPPAYATQTQQFATPPQQQQMQYSQPLCQPNTGSYYGTHAQPVSPESSIHESSMNSDSSMEYTPERDQASHVMPTMQPLSMEEIEAREQPPLSPMEKAVKSLVNLDDITEKFETPEQKKTIEKKKQNQPCRSKPLPPTPAEWHLGTKPKLGDIKQHAPPKKAPAKEIMRTHAFDPAAVHAGMMVVYGATIPQPSGFGAGVHQSHYQYYGYQQQMPQQQMMPVYHQ